MYALIYLE